MRPSHRRLCCSFANFLYSFPSFIAAGQGAATSYQLVKKKKKTSEANQLPLYLYRDGLKAGPTYNIRILQSSTEWNDPSFLIFFCSSETRVVLNEWRKSGSSFCLNHTIRDNTQRRLNLRGEWLVTSHAHTHWQYDQYFLFYRGLSVSFFFSRTLGWNWNVLACNAYVYIPLDCVCIWSSPHCFLISSLDLLFKSKKKKTS